MNNQLGILYGVSVGTGDPELITVKGVKIIQKCSIVSFPAGIKGKKGIAERIIQVYIQPHQQTLPLNFPYTQDEKELKQAWELASLELLGYLKKGQDIAFACEGDVSLYSSFTYLAQTLRQLQPSLSIQFIAGVASPMAAANLLQIPLTTQQEKLAIIPALYSIEELEIALNWAETVVLLKVASVYQQVWQVIQHKNLWASAWVVEKVSFAEEKIYYPLNNYPQLQLSYFSLLIIKQS